jgi:hypothetical protein
MEKPSSTTLKAKIFKSQIFVLIFGSKKTKEPIQNTLAQVTYD